MCVYMYVETRGKHQVSSSTTLLIIFETESLTEPRAHKCNQVGGLMNSKNPPVSISSVWEF